MVATWRVCSVSLVGALDATRVPLDHAVVYGGIGNRANEPMDLRGPVRRHTAVEQSCPPLPDGRGADLPDGEGAEMRLDVVAEHAFAVVARPRLERPVLDPSAAELGQRHLREPRIDPLAPQQLRFDDGQPLVVFSLTGERVRRRPHEPIRSAIARLPAS
jgi:hypothetical protein